MGSSAGQKTLFAMEMAQLYGGAVSDNILLYLDLLAYKNDLELKNYCGIGSTHR